MPDTSSSHSVCNSLLQEQATYSGQQRRQTRASLWQYNADSFTHTAHVDLTQLSTLFHPEQNNWLVVSGLSDNNLINQVFNQLKLHHVDTKSIMQINNYSSIREYDERTIFRVNSLSLDEGDSFKEHQISFILGTNYLVTFLEEGAEVFEEVIEAIHVLHNKLRTEGCDYLLIILLDKLISQYQAMIDRIEQHLDHYTDLVVRIREDNSVLARTLLHRRSYVRLKHVVSSLKDALAQLSLNQNKLTSEHNLIYLETLLQQLQFIGQDVENCEQSFNAILNLHFNNGTNKMNDIIKRLTVISTIFLPMTFLVGLWGMNFSYMPEIQWRWGYIMAWVVILLTGIGSWLYVKRRKWY